MALDDDYSWNSLYVDLKYRFVDVGKYRLWIRWKFRWMIRIHCGFRLKKVFWAVFILIRLDNMRTFDKDGFVVETSSDVIEGVPKITGVTCDSVVLYENCRLRIQNCWRNPLTLTQLLKI